MGPHPSDLGEGESSRKCQAKAMRERITLAAVHGRHLSVLQETGDDSGLRKRHQKKELAGEKPSAF